MVKRSRRKVTSELIFVLYFWRVVILKPITKALSGRVSGTYIILIFAAVLFGIELIKYLTSARKNKRLEWPSISLPREPIYYIFIVAYLILTIDWIFRPNSYGSGYFNQLLFYGVIPAILLLQIKDVSKLLRIYSVFSIVLFIIWGLDPLFDYYFFGSYMTFGFQLALPAYFGINIARTYFKKKPIIILEILALIDIAVFANRSCILCILLYWILKDMFLKKWNMKENIRRASIVLVSVIAFFNIGSIVNLINNIFIQFGYKSYSLSQYVYYFNNGTFFTTGSGREIIWQQAFDMFLKSPIFGNGSGSFYTAYGYYTHNLLLDLLVQYGTIVCILFVLALLYATWNIFRCKNNTTKLFGFFLLCLWCPKLFFNTYLFQEIGIWCYLAFGLSSRFFVEHESVIEDDDNIDKKYEPDYIKFDDLDNNSIV